MVCATIILPGDLRCLAEIQKSWYRSRCVLQVEPDSVLFLKQNATTGCSIKPHKVSFTITFNRESSNNAVFTEVLRYYLAIFLKDQFEYCNEIFFLVAGKQTTSKTPILATCKAKHDKNEV